VFGFRDSETKKTRDHVSRHMTDGQIDFTLMKYDAGTQSAESKAAGEGPCIHHFAIEVPDIEKAREEIEARGCEVVSDPGVIPVKFRARGGTVAELVPSAATSADEPVLRSGDFWSGLRTRGARRLHRRQARRWDYMTEEGPAPGSSHVVRRAMMVLSLALSLGAVLKPASAPESAGRTFRARSRVGRRSSRAWRSCRSSVS
jgi:lactoylglutathione lyase